MTQGATKPFIMAALATAAALAGIGGYAYVESHRPAVLELFVFNTPGNPAIFIRTPNDKRILINGGSNSEIIERISGILPFYSRRIDTVIATDDDPKNVTGLVDVVNRYSVDKVVVACGLHYKALGLASSSDPIYETFLAAIDSHKIPVQEVVAGQRLILDQPSNDSYQLAHINNVAGSYSNQPVVADILFPVTTDSNPPSSTSTKAFQYSKASSPQILMRINYGTTSFMLMSDASVKIQKFIAVNNELPADALITSNNGNASNLALQLIDSIAPDYFIYSAQVLKDAAANNNKSPTTKSAATSKSKPKADPLAGILNENRFNIREKGMVKIVSDGNAIKITDN
jgi:beta-lactamase superfamily II metal-dependent hydrolase